MALVPSFAPRLWCGSALGLVAGLLVSSCATGSPADSAEPPPADGGFAGNDGGTDDAAGGTGGGGTGGTGGTHTGGTGGSGGTGGADPTGQCGTCTNSDDCLDGFVCVTSPNGHPFCAADCSSDPCPAGDYDCVNLSTYDSESGESGEGCVPSGDASCACTSELEGETRPCFSTNSEGTCAGTETCTAGSWKNCNAPLAEQEICDGEDNNCNGFTDMDEPGLTGNDLCAGGSAPPHSGFTCVSGNCDLAGCEPGWARFPENLPVTAGCACAVDEADIDPATNETCADAEDVGAVPDEGATPKLIEGTLHSVTDVDWYAFDAVDTNQVPSFNTYRVHIEFLQPDGNPGDEYLFDVIRGTTAAPCTGEKTTLTSYDWCADSTTTPATPADDDHTAPYRLKVYRNPASTGTCNAYKIRITNGGSGACPPADVCGGT